MEKWNCTHPGQKCNGVNHSYIREDKTRESQKHYVCTSECDDKRAIPSNHQDCTQICFHRHKLRASKQKSTQKYIFQIA